MNNLTRRNLLAGAAGATAATVLPFEMPVKAATPPAGKQAPGWYRYKIGTIEIPVATDGVARFKMAEDHVTNIKLDAVNAALAEVFMEKDMMTTPYNPIAVNTGSKLAVIGRPHQRAADGRQFAHLSQCRNPGAGDGTCLLDG
jgi:hypothetical protein